MPTYDYRCNACQHLFEEFQTFSEKPLKKCPKCGKSKLERLIGTGAAILFKGSGFYQTDYRSEGYKSAAKADESKASAPKEATSDSGGAAKSESKGAASETKSPSPTKNAKSKD